MRRSLIRELVGRLGEPYHRILGIDLSGGDSGEIFKWFLASVLFGARISETIAIKTYRQLERDGLLTPERILARGWSRLVESLDKGGYVRYDYKTADKLLLLSDMLLRKYRGDLNRMHDEARDSADLEGRLKEFKGVGDVTANIFLRELRGTWPKANPLPQEPVILAAKNLGLIEVEDRRKALDELLRLWRANALPNRSFIDFEVALLRLGKLYCKKSRCDDCFARKWCKR
jgi:endonuclease III